MSRRVFLIGAVSVFILFLISFSIYWYFSQQKDANYAEILKHLRVPGILTVGGDIPYGIMEFLNDRGEPDGFDVDFAKNIADRLGVTLQYKDYDWDSLFPALENGEFDLIISSVSITPERSEKFLFSAPYFSGGQAVIVRSNPQDINSFDNINGKKIGVQTDTTGYIEAKKYTDEKNIVAYKEMSDYYVKDGIVSDLDQGIIDVIITDYISAISIVKKNPTLKLLGDPFTEEYYGVVAKKENSELIKVINEIIREMKSGGYLNELEKKWK